MATTTTAVPGTLSPAAKTLDEEKARRERTVWVLLGSATQSAMQHGMTIQAEQRLFQALCNQDLALTASTLANTAGLMGVLALFVNQVGGKLSDAVGRKPLLLVGPIGNIAAGFLTFSFPQLKWLLILCRLLKHVGTTFS